MDALDDAAREQLGRYYKSLAQARGLTQVKLAGALQMDRGQVSRMWRGLIKKPDQYRSMAEHFGLEWSEARERARAMDQALVADDAQGGAEMTAAPRIEDPPPTPRASPRAGTFGPQAPILAVASEKGGVGKTALAVSLAHLWAKQGLAVLLVDLDTQGNATRHVGAELGGESLEEATDPRAEEARLEPDAHAFGFDLVRGGRYVLGAVSHIQQRRLPSIVLRRLIRPLRTRYDVILLDTPPTLGLLSINAIVSATHLVVPVQLEGAAIDGLDAVLETVDELRDINPELELLASVPMMHDRRTALSGMLLRQLQQMEYAHPVEVAVSRNVSVAEAYVAAEPPTAYAPSSRGARDLTRLADELAGRLRP